VTPPSAFCAPAGGGARKGPEVLSGCSTSITSITSITSTQAYLLSPATTCPAKLQTRAFCRGRSGPSRWRVKTQPGA
jgi:hypothetical protein